jgi:hypothetical protein
MPDKSRTLSGLSGCASRSQTRTDRTSPYKGCPSVRLSGAPTFNSAAQRELDQEVMKTGQQQTMRVPVKVCGAEPLHILQRSAEDLQIGDEAWVSLDGEVAYPARVIDKDDRHYGVRFECRAGRAGVYPGERYFFFLDEVRTTPELACINMVTM